ncbi:hypothetical protein NP233_g8700 [Leucocoprinus birnbaumii]|uniref:Pentacotripeptide-repeat region of PRORP domain-containing protein n=1 Tax=Leucocoprinus birnbaumii TaxID=56174 RepID=A0AAD5VSB8_9AGAR|nr:hypothetical protein NP233_g8700 [Leucocoprinus birnbaumii]
MTIPGSGHPVSPSLIEIDFQKVYCSTDFPEAHHSGRGSWLNLWRYSYETLYFLSALQLKGLNFSLPTYLGRHRDKRKSRRGRERNRIYVAFYNAGTRNWRHCPTHDIPFMLQELLPPRERPVHRFQSSRARNALRFTNSKLTSSRTKNVSTGQRRHVSHHVRSSETLAPDRSEASSSQTSWHQAWPQDLPPSSSPLSKFIHVKKLRHINLEFAWDAFNAFRESGIAAGETPPENLSQELLVFVERFCTRVEMFYHEDNSYSQLKVQRERFRAMVDYLQEHFDASERGVQLLIARLRAMYGQFDAAIEILRRIRKAIFRTDFGVSVAYRAIYSSIFYFHDSVHVVEFLTQHYFFEYFRPPYCYHYRDEGDTCLRHRHPRLLYILASLQDPVSLFKARPTKQSPDRYHVYQLLILAYCQYKLPQQALCVYDTAQALSDYSKDMDDRLKLRIVRALVQGGFFDDANRLYDTIDPSTPEHRNTGIHLFALQGDINAVKGKFSLDTDNKHRRAMKLQVYAVRGQTEVLRTLFNEMYPRRRDGKYKFATPDAMDYAIVIYGHARRGDPEGMQPWFDRMIDDGIQPNIYVCKEWGLRQNAVVYTNIITALSRHHKPSTAEGIFKRALRDKVIPDQAMVGALMNAYVEAGQWDEVVSLFSSVQQNSRSPLRCTIEMYNIALKGYVMMGAPFRVVATLFERLDQDGNVAPTPITFALLLQSACEGGYMAAAMEIYQEMVRRAKLGQESLMNPFTFTILISGFLRKGDKDKAMEIYQEMTNRGIQPTSVTFNSVLSYYSNEQAKESLQMAYEFMTRIANQGEDALVMLKEKLDLPPAHLVYEPLLRGYSSNGNVEGFEKLLQNLLDAGGRVTLTILTYLLNLYRTKGRVESATKVWTHLLELGTETMNGAKFPLEGQPDIEARTDMLCVPLTLYLDTLSAVGEHEEVLEVWQDYQKRGFSFNFFNWNRLGEYLICAGDYERAFEVLDRILLPYVRYTRNEPRTSSESDAPETAESSSEETWQRPFDVLNKTTLSFLQTIVSPTRPLTSTTRSKIFANRRESRQDNDEIIASLALKPPSRSPYPSSTDEFSPPTEPAAPSESPSTSSPASQDGELIPFHDTGASSSSRSLEVPEAESTPDFVRPLWILGHVPEGNAPKLQYSLLQYLLIGIQRLRAGQPPIASINPGQTSHEDLYGADYSPKQQQMLRDMLAGIHDNYPDAVAEVLAFEERERIRLGDNYEKFYIWA